MLFWRGSGSWPGTRSGDDQAVLVDDRRGQDSRSEHHGCPAVCRGLAFFWTGMRPGGPRGRAAWSWASGCQNLREMFYPPLPFVTAEALKVPKPGGDVLSPLPFVTAEALKVPKPGGDVLSPLPFVTAGALRAPKPGGDVLSPLPFVLTSTAVRPVLKPVLLFPDACPFRSQGSSVIPCQPISTATASPGCMPVQKRSSTGPWPNSRNDQAQDRADRRGLTQRRASRHALLAWMWLLTGLEVA